MPEFVMIVEVLVPERDPEHALADEGSHLVLDQVRAAPVRKAGRKTSDQVDYPVGRPEQQRSGIRGERAPPPPGDLRRVQNRTGLRYTVSASGSTSESGQVVAAQQL